VDGRIPDVTVTALEGTPPAELERGQWRLTLHRRSFASPAYARDTGLAEISDARSRRLELALNGAATLTFTLDGASPAAAWLQELTTEVMAWRWDADAAADRLMFRGVVAQTQDSISETVHTVTVTAHDYLSVAFRRPLTSPNDLTYTQTDQDDIAADLLARASDGFTKGDGTPLAPGSHLPLALSRVNPDGSARPGKSGRLRDRTYSGGKSIGEALTELGACQGGYDLDVLPAADSAGTDYLRVFYGAQGVTRSDLVLAYGSSVSSVSRSVNSVDYANYVRTTGADTGPPQQYADAANADAASGIPTEDGRLPVGLWASTANAADVSLDATLADQTAGELERSGILIPSYTLGIRPEWWIPDNPAMGDTVALVIRSGRLDVSTTVRVLGINYAVSDDGAEDVELTVGRPALELTQLFRGLKRDVDALARR